MSNAVVNVLSGFNGQLGLVNTGMGAKNPDGTIDISGTAQGVASTVESQFAMAGKSYGLVQFGIGAWGVYNVGTKVFDNYVTTGTFSITGAQAANLAGNLASMGMGIYKSTPWGAAAGVGITVIEYGFNLTTKSQQPTASNPNNTNYGNQGLGTPLQASILLFNYRGAGFSDPRLLTVRPTLAARLGLVFSDFGEVIDQNLTRLGFVLSVGAENFDYRLTRLESDIADAWNQSKEWTGDLRDPLAIDLDGDGIETIGADGTVVFDHNGDGVKTGTGWVVYPPAHAHRTGWQQPIRHV